MKDEMMMLVHSFPSLRGYRGNSDGRFDSVDFYTWALGGHATSGTVVSALFILDVWNGERRGRWPWRKLGSRFSLRGAFGVWDREHVAAFLAWANDDNRVTP
jgi:hypothetical protein